MENLCQAIVPINTGIIQFGPNVVGVKFEVKSFFMKAYTIWCKLHLLLVDGEKVEALMESIQEIGLQDPVSPIHDIWHT